MLKLIHIWIRLCNWVRRAQNHLFRSRWMVRQWSMLRISKSQMIKRWSQLKMLQFRTRSCPLWMRLLSYSNRIKQRRYRRTSHRMWWWLRTQPFKIKQTQLTGLQPVWSSSRKLRNLRCSSRDPNLKRLTRLLRQSLPHHPWQCSKPKRPWLRSSPNCHQPKNHWYLLVPQQQ